VRQRCECKCNLSFECPNILAVIKLSRRGKRNWYEIIIDGGEEPFGVKGRSHGHLSERWCQETRYSAYNVISTTAWRRTLINDSVETRVVDVFELELWAVSSLLWSIDSIDRLRRSCIVNCVQVLIAVLILVEVAITSNRHSSLIKKLAIADRWHTSPVMKT